MTSVITSPFGNLPYKCVPVPVAVVGSVLKSQGCGTLPSLNQVLEWRELKSSFENHKFNCRTVFNENTNITVTYLYWFKTITG
jgi:hypothetical protein